MQIARPNWLKSLAGCNIALSGWMVLGLAWLTGKASGVLSNLSSTMSIRSRELIDGAAWNVSRCLILLANLLAWVLFFLLIAWRIG